MQTCQEDIWKEFDRNAVTHSAAHYVVCIAELLRSRGYARVSDVARALNITRGSASLTLKALRQKGFVTEDDNRFLRLSAKGERVAQAVAGKSCVLRRFFSHVLGVPEQPARVDACKIEHLIGEQTMQRLAALVRFIESDSPEAIAFVQAWRVAGTACEDDSLNCPVCERECVQRFLAGADQNGSGSADALGPADRVGS